MTTASSAIVMTIIVLFICFYALRELAEVFTGGTMQAISRQVAS